MAKQLNYHVIGTRILGRMTPDETRKLEVTALSIKSAMTKAMKELGLTDLIEAHVEFVFSFCFKSDTKEPSKTYKQKNAKAHAKIGSSGDSAQIGSSGDSAQIGSSGDSAQIGSSGDSAQIGSSGDSAQITLDGKHSIGSAIGYNGRAKGKNGNWIVLAEWKEQGEHWVPTCVKTGKIGEDNLKEDTWYVLKGGKFTEYK